MSEARGGGNAGVGALDPSKLHLRKELTQIRKAARVLRDPGTTSSWGKSPLPAASSRSVPNVAPPSSSPGFSASANGVAHGNGVKQKRVFLHNWRNNCISSSEKSTGASPEGGSIAAAAARNGDSSSSSPAPGGAGEDEVESLNGAEEDSKSEGSYIGRNGHRRDANMVLSAAAAAISLRRPAAAVGRRKSKKMQRQQHHRKSSHARRLLLPRNAGNAPAMCLGFNREKSGGLVDHSDDTEDCCSSKDFRGTSLGAPLISRVRYKNSSHSPSNLLIRSTRKEDSSCTYNSTPALSTSSYHNRFSYNLNPSTAGSWDCTTTSLHGGDDWDDDDRIDFPGRQGCGIPCYWSRRSTPKHRAYGSRCCSPSFSDTLRRKGSSILCGSQTMYRHRRRRLSSDVLNKRKIASRSAQGVLPLLTNGSSMGSGGQSDDDDDDDDDLPTNFEELDLEALSRLDGRRWSSSCRSEEALELPALTAGGSKDDGTPDNLRSLSQKYRPMFFDELVGQNFVVQSLSNAASRGRIAPVYLFQGPRGTGKTSAARIFAAALNCMATEGTKPCGICRECADFMSSKSKDLTKIDGTSKRAADRVRSILRKLLILPQTAAFSRYKVLVIDECHLLPSKLWVSFLKFLEEPLPRIVFIFLTTDLDSMPRPVISRCQKYLFNKIKDCDIVARLRKLSDEESLNVELDAINLIALNADGSLRDAETMLDQLSLLGKRITASLVNELLGVVSDDKLLELLELAMSPDTAETVRRARELLDSGVDPAVLMSQLAGLIMDLIAGTYRVSDTDSSGLLFGGRSLTETELERLKHALRLLSDAEKQLRVSSERSTWFTAALLQLGTVSSSDFTQSGSSRRQSSKTTDEDPSSASREAAGHKHGSDGHFAPRRSTSSSLSIPYANHGDLLSLANLNSKPTPSHFVDCSESSVSHENSMVGNATFSSINSRKLDDIWAQCIERCHSKTLRQLLASYGKLLSISEVEGSLIAYIAFKDEDVKSRVERFLSSVTDSIETILRCNVEARIILFSDIETSKPFKSSNGLDRKQRTTMSANREAKPFHGTGKYSERDTHLEPFKLRKENHTDTDHLGGTENYSSSPSVVARSPFLSGGNTGISGKNDGEGMPMQRIESIIREQKLETAWLQTAEKGTPGSISRLKLERNQVLPQDGMFRKNRVESINSKDLSSGHWEEELNHGKAVSTNGTVQKDQISKRVDRYPMSPSLLHDASFVNEFGKDTLGYESGAGGGGCSSLLCWNGTRNHKRGKVKQVPAVRRGFLLFGECGLSKKRQSKV